MSGIENKVDAAGQNHFAEVSKMVDLGSGAKREMTEGGIGGYRRME